MLTTQDNGQKPFPAEPLTIIIMNTEELYIWNYGIDKLPKGLLEFGKSDVCDTYDESKRQKFQNHGQWMWKNNIDQMLNWDL